MFRKTVLVAGLLLSPTLAHAAPIEGRVMAIGGMEFRHEESDPFLGAALGADFELDKHTFAGAEVSAEHALRGQGEDECAFGFDEHARKVAVTVAARAGLVLDEVNKVYALAGVRFAEDESPLVYGLGVERKIGKFVASLEYRRVSEIRTNQVGIGLGLTF